MTTTLEGWNLTELKRTHTPIHMNCAFIHWIFYPKIICHRSIEEEIYSIGKHEKFHIVNICTMVFTLEIFFWSLLLLLLFLFVFFVYRSILFGYTCGRYFTNMPHANIIVPLRIKRMQKKILKYLQCFHIMLANLTLIRCAYLKTALE